MTKQSIPCILFTLTLGIFVRPAAAEHPALTGVWQLDVAASAFGAMPPLSSAVLTISTNPHKILHVMVVTQSPHQQRTEDSEWKIDDHYHPVDGSSSGEVLAKWQGDVLVGKRLTDGRMEETRFHLGPGGERLTESIESGTNMTTLIWRRQ
jgi:hypothetical protein